MSVNAWIVVGDQPAIGNLIAVARALGEAAGADGQVAAVVAGPRPVAETVAASGVDRVVWCAGPDDAPAEAGALAVADVVAADPPRVVLGGRNPGERVLLGAAAARLRAAVLTGASRFPPTATASSWSTPCSATSPRKPSRFPGRSPC